MTTLRTLGLVTFAAIALLTGCGEQGAAQRTDKVGNSPATEKPRSTKSAARFTETVLCPYKKDTSGGFSPYWAAYIIEPVEDAKDQFSFVELNGRRLGPYSQVSGMMVVSRDGKHIAFAAEKGNKWVVVVDGVEKYTHDGLVWPWCAWSPTLEGDSYIPQTRAAVLEFSQDGRSIAYPAKTENGEYAVFVNGVPGPSYPSIGSSISFVDGRVKYYAFPEENRIVEVHGKQVLGPYSTSYKTKVSADGNHYCFWAKTADKNVLVVDGQTHDLPGEVSDYVIGNEGVLAYAYKSASRYRVRVGKTDLPGDYDEVTQMTLSPDYKKVAFWARRSGKWSLVVGDKELPGFDGYFYYQCGGSKYSVMWSQDSKHIAYYVREGPNGVLILDGQKLEAAFRPPGLALQIIVDDDGHTVGAGLMQGPQMETAAFVQAVLMRDQVKCDPFSATLVGQTLCYIEKDETHASMHIGERKEGQYKSIRSVLFTLRDGSHYAYLVQTDKGDQVVIDGTIRPQTYDAIYRPIFNDADGTLELLAVKAGNLVRVVQPLGSE
jgi:hypothetical protein